MKSLTTGLLSLSALAVLYFGFAKLDHHLPFQYVRITVDPGLPSWCVEQARQRIPTLRGGFLRLNVGDTRQRMTDIPGVAEASIVRDWRRRGLQIHLHSAQFLGVLNNQGLLTDKGRVVPVLPAAGNLPRFIIPKGVAPQEFFTLYQTALPEIQSIGTIDSAKLDLARNVAFCSGSRCVQLGDPKNLPLALQRVKLHLEHVNTQYPNWVYWDLRYNSGFAIRQLEAPAVSARAPASSESLGPTP